MSHHSTVHNYRNLQKDIENCLTIDYESCTLHKDEQLYVSHTNYSLLGVFNDGCSIRL